MASEYPYSLLERTVQRILFSSAALQELLDDLERLCCARYWEEIEIVRPVFITSLPRAGTTILLEALASLPGMASHEYRDMPFVFTPLLWHRLSSGLRREREKVERFHGDGICIDVNSPEGLEEVFWKKCFGEHYTGTGIELWHDSDNRFGAYFREQLKKVIALRGTSSTGAPGRYVSKNNANIARTRVLSELFPDAFVLVPLRNPLEHAISMWRQHHNFLQRHTTNSFARRYMDNIGHYEFGELHRPIRFPHLDAIVAGFVPHDLDYWLAYWIAAFEHLRHQEKIDFVCYEQLSTSGGEGFSALASHLAIEASNEALEAAAAMLHSPLLPGGRGINSTRRLQNGLYPYTRS